MWLNGFHPKLALILFLNLTQNSRKCGEMLYEYAWNFIHWWWWWHFLFKVSFAPSVRKQFFSAKIQISIFSRCYMYMYDLTRGGGGALMRASELIRVKMVHYLFHVLIICRQLHVLPNSNTNGSSVSNSHNSHTVIKLELPVVCSKRWFRYSYSQCMFICLLVFVIAGLLDEAECFLFFF